LESVSGFKTRSGGTERLVKSILNKDLTRVPSASPKTCYSSRPEGRLMRLPAILPAFFRAERL